MSENIDNELLTADSINDGAEVDEALLEKTAGWTDSRISSIALPTTEQLTGYDANEWGSSELLYSWLEGYYYTSDNESLGGGRWRVEGTYLDYFSSAGIRPVITISQNNWTIDKMGVYQLEVMEGDPVVADFDDNAPERLRVKINGGEVEDYAYSNGIFTINNVTGNLEVMRRIPILKTLTDSKVLLNNIYDVIDIHAGDMLDYKIYGNSVVENETVNLFNVDAAVNDGVINEWSDALSKNEDGSYTLEKLPQGYRFTQAVPMFIASGTTIAMSVDIIDDGTQYGGLRFMLLDSSGEEVSGGDLTNNGLITSASADVHSIQFILSGNELVGNYITFKNLQIEIGNKITDYRPYDEDKYQDYLENGLSKEIQSVGDLVVDTNNSNYGKYEIPLTLRMKNLININDFYKGGGLAKADYVEGTILTSDSKNYYKNYNQKFSLNNGVINILGKNDAATPGKGSTAVGFLYIGTTEKWEAGTTYYFSCNIDVISNYYNTDTSYFRATIDGKTFSIKKNATTGRYEGQVTLGSSVSNITNRYVQFRVDGCELNISNMLLSKSPDTTYRAYEESIVHSIYLDEPLRCVGDTCDYIDFKKQQVIRNVGVNTNVNSTVINEKFYVLNTPLIEPISLPAVSLVKGVNEIIVDTMLSPSKVTVYYYD